MAEAPNFEETTGEVLKAGYLYKQGSSRRYRVDNNLNLYIFRDIFLQNNSNDAGNRRI